MSQRPSTSARTEIGIALLLFILANAFFALTQPQIAIDGGRGWDGAQYYTVGEQVLAGTRPTAEAPFVYRSGTPWLAAHVAPGDLIGAFRAVNVVANAATILLLVIFLRRHVRDVRVRLALVVAFIFVWHGPVRFVWFYPVASEHIPFAANLAVLVAADWLRTRANALALALISIVAFVGTTARETALLAPAALLFARAPIRRALPSPRTLVLAVPFVAGLAAFVFVHAIATQTNSYSYSSALFDWLRLKSVFTYVLGWWNGYGPLLAVPIVAWRGSLAFLRTNQSAALFLLACAALGWVGGQDTERYTFWAAPVVYALAGRAIVSALPWLTPIAVAVLAASQAVVERIVWPIPQPSVFDPLVLLPPERPLRTDVVYVLTPFGNTEYFDLWSFWMPRAAKTIVLVEYAAVLVVVAVAVVVMRRGRRSVSPPASARPA